MKELNIYNIENIDILRAEYKKLEEKYDALSSIALNMIDSIYGYFPIISFLSSIIEEPEKFNEISNGLKCTVTYASISAFKKSEEIKEEWNNYSKKYNKYA